MPCATCGAVTEIVNDSTGNTSDGPFSEQYECVNGHRGAITGDAAKPPRTWARTGAVFNEREY